MEEIYKFIENNYYVDTTSRHNVKIRRFLNKYRNNDTYAKYKQQIEWEIEFFEFIIKQGNVNPLNNNTNKKGNVITYPNYDNFTNDRYEYLIERIKTDNILLSLRYRHILIKSNNNKYKKDGFVKETIDLYLSLLVENSKKDYNDIFLFVLENALPLAVNRKNYRIDDFYNELENFIPKITDKYILIDLVDICLIHNDLKVKEILKKTIKIFDKFINDSIEKAKQTPVIFDENLIIDCKIKLLNKLGIDANQEYINKGWSFEQLANKGNFIDNDFMFEAIKCYNKARDKQLEQLATLKYTKLKRRLQLATVTNEYYSKPITEIFDVLNTNAIKISKKDGNSILQYISKSNNIFIDNQPKQDVTPSSLDGLRVLNFDINGNIDKKINKKQYYSFKFTIEYLKLIFKNSILSGSLTYETISKYILEHTWLGKNLPAKSLNNDDYTYNWFSLISPSVYNFITQYTISLNNNNFNANYILAIDSLSIKFEAILKDFAFYNNIPIDKYDDRKEKMRELYIEDILNNKSSKSLIGEENINFMKYVFTKNGLDIRNNIAHCYFNYSNYNSDKFLLILIAFLRIGSFKLKYLTSTPE